MTLWEALTVFIAGIGAGTINTIVGSGTLLTFPILLAVGLPPITANVSNSLGLAPGSLSGAIGYRRELVGQRARLVRLGLAALLGSLVGAWLLIVLPSAAFDAVIPVLILLAVLLVIFQPRLAKAVAARRTGDGDPEASLLLLLGIFLSGVYGGYFGAAMGVIMLALMGMMLHEDLQRLNATKNVLALIVNAIAAFFFLFVADFNWTAVVLIAVGSVLGGQIGARVGRRLPPVALRGIIVVVGLVAVVKLLLD